eukprot:m.23605 g.23605  ORF g.23605 m.23605 type:complete len:783 (+) comp4088_c0_seq2:273-2621(+)
MATNEAETSFCSEDGAVDIEGLSLNEPGTPSQQDMVVRTDVHSNALSSTANPPPFVGASESGVRQRVVQIDPKTATGSAYGSMPFGRKSAPPVNATDAQNLYRAHEETQGYQRSVSRTPQPYTESVKASNNYLFGMKMWPARQNSEPSYLTRELYEPVSKRPKNRSVYVNRFISVGNIVYVALFGWILALAYILMGCVLWLSLVGQGYTQMCWDLGVYMFWPFGKYVVRHRTIRLSSPHVDNNGHLATGVATESTGLLEAAPTPEEVDASSRSPSPVYVDVTPKLFQQKLGEALKRPGFYVWAVMVPFLWLLHGFVVIFCGFLVVFIPMAKIQWLTMSQLLLYDPNTISVIDTPADMTESADILMCTYQAVNVYYYKYTIEGMNICLVNLMIFVVLAIFFGHIDKLESTAGKEVVFVLSTLSVIPLAYYIGMSIANISAQSNFAVGAVLNATFGSVVELIIYYQALQKGLKVLVKASLTGTLLATMLFLPGLFMVIGGLKYDEQRFNLRSAGVSSSLLFVSVAGAYSPSLFQMVFGAHNLECTEVIDGTNGNLTNCYWRNLDDFEMEQDHIYNNKTRKLVWFCCALLPLAYIIGLLYTLRTHVHHIFRPPADDEEEAGHHTQLGPMWSKLKSISILLVSTILLAVVAEQVVDNIEPIVEKVGVSEEAMGLIIVALLPDVAEIMNGIHFARQNNIALSIEVGTSLAVQVCLLQMPILVLLSEAFLSKEDAVDHFTLVFPSMYTFTVFFSVILMNYIFQDGKSDYFQGAILIIIYAIMCGIIMF